MFYLYIVVLPLAFASLFTYVYFIRRLRRKGWIRAQNEPPTPDSEGKIIAGLSEKWLFAGPGTNSVQSHHQVLAHYPVYMVRLAYLFLVRLPRFVYGMLSASLQNRQLSFAPEVSEREIYQIFINGPLLVMARIEGDLLEFEIPEMSLKTTKEISPATLRLIFNSASESIELAEWQGKDIRNDRGRIVSLLVITLAMWAHPQTHVAAERSAREIAEKKVLELEPSNRFVVAVHDGLLYGKISPLSSNQPLSINVNKMTGLESATQFKIPHRITPQKHRFRYYNFLIEARKILYKQVKIHGLEVNVEFLFNNMIVHSVDHHFLYLNLKKIPAWSLDGGSSIGSYWRSQMFVAVWVRHVTSPFEEEKIGKLSAKKYPFYHAVHQDLMKIDAELADSILASTSF